MIEKNLNSYINHDVTHFLLNIVTGDKSFKVKTMVKQITNVKRVTKVMCIQILKIYIVCKVYKRDSLTVD